jgi:SAM-dependent methyltransferase
MVIAGHGRFLVKDACTKLTCLLYYPIWRSKATRGAEFLSVRTDYPVAFDSPDHLTPHGTAENNITHYGFIVKMTKLLGPSAYLDLGCSGGQLVVDFYKMGWRAVGVEGSDYSKKHGRAAWKDWSDKILFTADIGKPFDINSSFELITAWEVFEHLDRDRLIQVCENIKRFSRPGTLLIVTTASTSEVVNGTELHVTQWKPDQWEKFLEANLGWKAIKPPFSPLYMPRLSVDGRPVVLRRPT